MFKKELEVLRTGPTPAFLILDLRAIDESIDMIGDYVFAYNPKTMLAIGAAPVSAKTVIMSIQGDDYATPELENIAYGDIFYFGYYDAQADKFWKLEADFYNLYGQDVADDPVFMGLNVLRGENNLAAVAAFDKDEEGNRIQVPLKIDQDLTEVRLAVQAKDNWTPNDPRMYVLKPDIRNIENVVVTAEGFGVFTTFKNKQWIVNKEFTGWAEWAYTVSVDDAIVKFTITGTNKYTGEQVQDIDFMAVQAPEIGEILYENMYMAIYRDGSTVYGIAKADQLLFAFEKLGQNGDLLGPTASQFLHDKAVKLSTVDMFLSNGGTWLIKTLGVGRKYEPVEQLVGQTFVCKFAEPFEPLKPLPEKLTPIVLEALPTTADDVIGSSVYISLSVKDGKLYIDNLTDKELSYYIRLVKPGKMLTCVHAIKDSIDSYETGDYRYVYAAVTHVDGVRVNASVYFPLIKKVEITEDLIGENAYVAFTVNSRGSLYIQNKTDAPVAYQLHLEKKTGGKVSTGNLKFPLDPKAKDLVTPIAMYKSVTIYKMMVNGEYIDAGETFTF